MANEREAALGALDNAQLGIGKSSGNGLPPRFVILLSKGSATLAYRGLYVVDNCNQENNINNNSNSNNEHNSTVAVKAHGWGPKNLHSSDSSLCEFFKFNTSKKGFTVVGSKSFGGTVDAVSLDPSLLKRQGR